MPSPVGHTLIGAALCAAWLLPRGPAREWPSRIAARRGTWLAGLALANAPDLDYLPGILAGEINRFHHNATHSAGWVLLTAAGLWLVWHAAKPAAAGRREFAFLLSLLASHLAADWLTADHSPPVGIPLLWPCLDTYVLSPITVFLHLEKATWADMLQWHNVRAVLREMAIGLPLLAAVLATRMRAHPK